MIAPSVVAGIDLVQIREVAQSLERLGEAYVRRIFTEDEIAYCSSQPPLAPARFAARFAAKEATLKALRLQDEGLNLRQIEVLRTAGGGTDLALHGTAKERAEAAGWTSWAVSLSHEGDYAIALVVVQVGGVTR
jgi:holo-[acyl-carrier protein] synthase